MTPRLLLCLVLLLPGIASAAPVEIPLSPAGATVAIRAYGLGLLPLDGQFDRFDGRLTYNAADRPPACRVTLRVQVNSLAVSNAEVRDTILGADFLDADRFPMLQFEGACAGDEIAGDLTMHGVTRRFTLSLETTKTGLLAQGRLRRADWGMVARPLVGGSTVRITVETRVPAGSVR